MPGHFRLLGEQSGDERLPFDLRGALLAYLAYAGSWLPREQVAFLFWPDTDEAGARRNLRQLINRTKSLQLSQPLELEPARLRWPVNSDVAELRRAVGRQQWDQVVELYRGELLEGRPLEANAGFGAWLELERENLRNTYKRAREHLAEELERSGDHAGAAAMLEPLILTEDLEEEALQAYMRNAYLAGQRQLALDAYERFARQLQVEMELTPLEETTRLAQLIRSAGTVTGAAPKASRSAPLQVRRPPRLVGRQEALEAAFAASTPVVLLSGEAGVGKTRLIEEVAPSAPYARCVEGLQSVPFQPVADIVRGALGAGWDPSCLGDYREDLARLVPEVLPGRPLPPAEPLTAKSRLLEAICRCLEGAYATPQRPHEPTFHVAIDDLQWADADTLELLTLLSNRTSLRLLGAYRRYETTPELERALTALRSAGRVTVVELEPLDEAQLKRLLATLMGVEEGPERFARWLHASSAGNVMFALETLKTMFENGLLAADTSGWHSELDSITRDYSELEAPRAISDVILRQMDRLSKDGVRVVQAAAVLGAGFAPSLLSAMLGSPVLAVQDALEELEQCGMVVGERFRHDLIRQSVYRAMAPGRLTLLHARAAEALEPQRGRSFEVERWIVVGEHLLAAGEALRAARALGRAASDLQEMGLIEQAEHLLRSSLERLTASPGGITGTPPPDPRAVTYLKIGLARCQVEHGELRAARELLEEALGGADTPELQGGALGARAQVHLRTGSLEPAREDARKAAALARRLEDRLLELNATSVWAEAEYHLGDLESAGRIVTANVEALRQEDLPLALAAQLASLGAILDDLGRHTEALEAHLEKLQIARTLGARHQMVNVALNLVECYRELGRPQDALDVAEEALALGQVDGTAVLRNNVASLLVELGRLKEAEAHSLKNVELADPTLRTLAWARLARIYHSRGEPERVNAALTRTLEHAPLTDYPVARISAAVHLVDLGTAGQRAAALSLVEDLDAETLPGAMKADVLRVRRAAAGHRGSAP